MAKENRTKKKLKKLGEYLKTDSRIIKEILAHQDKAKPGKGNKLFGEILMKKGHVTRNVLEEAVLKQRSDRLKLCELFSNIKLDELKKIRNFVSEVNVPSGKELIVQDTFGDEFYVLIHGRVLAFREDETGREVPLTFIEPLECIGEMGYFSDGRRAASIRAEEDSHLLKMTYDDLDEIFNFSPILAKNFLKLVTGRLRKTNLRFQDIVLKSRATEKSLESLSKFLDLSEIMSLQTGIEGLIKQVVAMASKVMNADRASLFLADHYQGELWSKVAEGVESREIRIPIGKGVIGWVAENDQMVNIPDAYDDERFDQAVDKKTGYKTKTILCGPVKNLQGDIVGVIQVINKKIGAFDEKDEGIFKAFAFQTAIAVENFHLYQKLMKNHEKMTMLFEITTSVAQTLDLDELIQKIIKKTSQIHNAERSSLFLIDKETGELWSRVAQGMEVEEIRFPKSVGLAGYVADTGELLNIKDAYESPLFNKEVDKSTGFRTRSVLSAPIRNREKELIGVTQVINKMSGHFDKEDEELLKTISSEIAVALENAQLFDQQVKMRNYLESIQNSITNSIITLDNDYIVVTANKTSADLFHKPLKNLIKKDIRTIAGTKNARLISLIDHVYSTNKPVVDSDINLILPAGEEHSININFVPLLEEDSKRRGVVLIFEDITYEKRLKATLKRYMPRDIVDRLLEDPNQVSLGGVRGKATVLFSDIREFTSIVESISAEDAVEFLNEYFESMVDIIFNNGGLLDKYIGDAIMAVFGVPIIKEDDAARAIKTALQMRDSLSYFNSIRKSKWKIPVKIGMGICSGEVVSGNIGSEKRMDFTVIGDEVNLASRLESLTKQYGVEILISESTKEEVGDIFTTRLIDQVLLKGKSNKIKIYEVLGEKGKSLTEHQEYFCKGLEYYRKGEFDEAEKYFKLGLEGDPLCAVFLDRCRFFRENKTNKNWDGVWIAFDK